MADLSATLAEAFRPSPVTPEVRSRRERLCDFIRRHESRVYDVSHPRASAVRELLGWDDETMANFVESPLLCHSSPHTSMNSFAPMLAFPWVLASAVRAAESRHGVVAVHARTQCTHHDFNDTFSKPHAWWHRDAAGEVVKTHVFARVPIKYHPVLSKRVPRFDSTPLDPVDRAALDLAELATNYAYFCVIYRMYLERTANFHAEHRIIEIPIDLLNRFTIGELGLLRWYDLLADFGLSLRIERDDAPLDTLTRTEAESLAESAQPWPERAVIAPNTINFAQFYLLGLALMVGGRRMAGYVPDMNREIQTFTARVEGWRVEPPAFLPFTSIPFAEVLGLADEAARCQRDFGFSTSLPLVAAGLGGEAGIRLQALLDLDYRSLCDLSLV
jgi:hypothetical protein